MGTQKGTRGQVDFMLKFNNVQTGLNFLVPTFWWDEFYDKNTNAQHFHQIQLPEIHPLEILFSCQVIQQQTPYMQLSNFKKFKTVFEEGWSAVEQQLRRRKEQLRGKLQRGRGCDWWTEGNLKGTLELFSPEISWSSLEEMGMQDLSWQVVCPQLYRYLTDNYKKNQGFINNTLTAIPVFIHPGQYIPSMPYHLSKQRINIRVVSYSFNRSSFLFSGFVEDNLTLDKLLQWLAEGLKVWSRENLDKQRNAVVYYDRKIYYDFFDGGVSVEGLNWESFSKICKGSLRMLSGRDIVEYSYWVGEGEEQNQTMKRQPVKKVKITNVVEEVPRRGFARINKQGMMEIEPYHNEKEREIHYATGEEVRVLKGPLKSALSKDVHSSTEGETPEQKLQKEKMAEISRIPHAMFKIGQVEEYRKTSETKMNSFISILETDSDVIVYPRQTISLAHIDHKCNKIELNQQGDYEEVEMQQENRPCEEEMNDEMKQEMEKLISKLNNGPGLSKKTPLDRGHIINHEADGTAQIIKSRPVISSHIVLD